MFSPEQSVVQPQNPPQDSTITSEPTKIMVVSPDNDDDDSDLDPFEMQEKMGQNISVGGATHGHQPAPNEIFVRPKVVEKQVEDQ